MGWSPKHWPGGRYIFRCLLLTFALSAQPQHNVNRSPFQGFLSLSLPCVPGRIVGGDVGMDL